MRISDWSSDVCSSDLLDRQRPNQRLARQESDCGGDVAQVFDAPFGELVLDRDAEGDVAQEFLPHKTDVGQELITAEYLLFRSEEHTSEPQSLMRISYAVFCLKKKKHEI